MFAGTEKLSFRREGNSNRVAASGHHPNNFCYNFWTNKYSFYRRKDLNSLDLTGLFFVAKGLYLLFFLEKLSLHKLP